MDIQFTDSCCNTHPTKTSWVNKGEFKPLSTKVTGVDRRTYQVGPKGAKKGIISLLDIHGFHPTSVQILSEKGFLVSAIDLFLNGPIPDDYMGDMTKLGAWVRSNVEYQGNHIRELVEVAVNDLRVEGCESFYIVGHCWGTHLAIRTATDLEGIFLGVAGPHPTAVSVPLVVNLKCPLALFPAEDDPNMLPVIEAVQAKGFGVPSIHVRYDDMPHGFCGGRGDWSIPEQKQAAHQVIETIAQFFHDLGVKEEFSVEAMIPAVVGRNGRRAFTGLASTTFMSLSTIPSQTKSAALPIADFRSDTLTQPSEEMFRVMQEASRGDDVYEEDESVRSLEAYVARLTGHEAGLFCASGTMTNQLAFRASLLTPPASILCDNRSHVYRHEAGGIASHSQATVYPVRANANNGHHLTVKDIAQEFVVDDRDVHMAPTRLISLENTLSGTVMPLDEIQSIGRFARERGVRLHLDGARVWNAAVAEGCSLESITKEFDSVSLCVSKGVGAPIGSVLVGETEFIRKARHFRKMFGGGWRQAGGLAAVAHWCIDNVWPTMGETHLLAKRLAQGLEQHGGGAKITIPVETNMVFLDLAGSGIRLSELSRRLEERHIKIGSRNAPEDQTQVRLVLHWQISQQAVDDFIEVVKDMAQNASQTGANQGNESGERSSMPVYGSR
ncbi:Threonine aldolase [Lunasporangiospora selenospora]|uniref:Threonine aldolase n=1 Tax=Lunasporangiospora selenospora TaxID=979761 RepID=A0A9P6FY06_9FUNG|nr:Threonine aldolase [Lunasporangiospora selenospora]